MYDPLVDWAVGEDTIGATNNANVIDVSSATTSAAAASSTSSNRAGNRQLAIGANSVSAVSVAIDDDTRPKQIPNEMTRDALAIQFAEIKPEWIQNRSVHIRTHTHAHTHIVFLNFFLLLFRIIFYFVIFKIMSIRFFFLSLLSLLLLLLLAFSMAEIVLAHLSSRT